MKNLLHDVGLLFAIFFLMFLAFMVGRESMQDDPNVLTLREHPPSSTGE
jgi:hypothetical protein